MAITLLGTNAGKGSSATVNLTDGITDGDLFIVCYSGDTAASTSNGNHSVRATAAIFNNSIIDAAANNAGNVVAQIHRIVVSTTKAWDGTYPYVHFNSQGVGEAVSITVYKVTGLATTPFDKSSSGTGTGTAASSGSTALLSQADEVVIGCVGGEDGGDAGDLVGVWTINDPYVHGNEQKIGTTGGGDASNVNVYSAAKIVSTTGGKVAQVTGMDNIDWAACIATYKIAAAGKPFTQAVIIT